MNIEIHGLNREIDDDSFLTKLWGKIYANTPREEWENHAVTIVSSKSSDRFARKTPFVRVFSDKKSDFALAKEFIKLLRIPGAGIKTFVECVLLEECFEL